MGGCERVRGNKKKREGGVWGGEGGGLGEEGKAREKERVGEIENERKKHENKHVPNRLAIESEGKKGGRGKEGGRWHLSVCSFSVFAWHVCSFIFFLFIFDWMCSTSSLSFTRR